MSILLLAVIGLLSPDGKISAEFRLEGGEPVVAVSREGKEFGSVTVGPEYGAAQYEVLRTAKQESCGSWKPVLGFRSEYPDNYVELTAELSRRGNAEKRRALTVYARVYDEGVAVRYAIQMNGYELEEIRRERTAIHPVKGTVAWAIPGTEATYPEDPVSVASLDRVAKWRMPLTMRSPDGLYSSVLEAYTVDWPRSFLKADGEGGFDSEFVIGVKEGRGIQHSPWRVVLLAPSAGGLIERAYLVENLNEPCRIPDAAEWLRPGFASRDGGGLDTDREIEYAKKLREDGVRYLQLDWGWYGTERAWTDEERENYRKKRPDLKDEDWIANTYANPFTCAKGYVPYHPTWERFLKYGRTNVNLDMPRLCAELKKLGMGVCLYLQGSVMESVDLEKLFSLYESWGVAGLKPGFVSYGSQQATNRLRELAATAARHHLWIDIHDAHIPDGFERTWPNVMITEGGGGEEGNHPVRQDCALPFARCLAGPFDYTPGFPQKLRTPSHQAAMLLIYPGPTAVLRPRCDYRATCGGALRLAASLPLVYDETKVVDGEIAKKIVVARRKGADWYVGGICGERTTRTELVFDFLEPGGEYVLKSVGDDGVVRTRTVCRGERTVFDMSVGGGFLAVAVRSN